MALFEQWYALDLGAYQTRFYDYSTQQIISFRSIMALRNNDVIDVGDEVLNYLYRDLDTIQIKYPISHAQFLAPIEALINKGLDQLNTDSLFRPCIVAVIPSDITDKQKKLWYDTLLNTNVRKVELLRLEELMIYDHPTFWIHSGHSYTEIGMYANGSCQLHQMIFYSGSTIDEAIQNIIFKQTHLFITKADASRIKEAASDAYSKRINAKLNTVGFDQAAHMHPVAIDSNLLWSAFNDVYRQITLWVKHCIESLGINLQRQVLLNGIELSGGLSNSYGLALMLSDALNCKIICTNSSGYDIIEALKEYKK